MEVEEHEKYWKQSTNLNTFPSHTNRKEYMSENNQSIFPFKKNNQPI